MFGVAQRRLVDARPAGGRHGTTAIDATWMALMTSGGTRAERDESAGAAGRLRAVVADLRALADSMRGGADMAEARESCARALLALDGEAYDLRRRPDRQALRALMDRLGCASRGAFGRRGGVGVTLEATPMVPPARCERVLEMPAGEALAAALRRTPSAMVTVSPLRVGLAEARRHAWSGGLALLCGALFILAGAALGSRPVDTASAVPAAPRHIASSGR